KGIGFVWFWIAVASVCALIGSAAAIHAYACHEDEFARRRSRQVFAQFAPCILAGGAMTLGIARSPEFIAVLPGLWAAVFGLGLIATRPHLPRGIGLVGLGYITAGAASILRMSPGDDPSGWVVGGTFGLGHLCTALVLWMGRDEDTHE
ncbi:MAG TPA: hypothetical protein VLM40_18920, partial [Gemmata sp.]|nr:hypothetical protein [Gemmata sp.]